MEMTDIMLCFKVIMILSNQSGAIRIVKNEVYALLNKETNKDVDALRGKYQQTQRRLRRSLTAEEKDKLMTVEISPTGCSSFACSDGKANKKGPRVFPPNLTMIEPPLPAGNITENETTRATTKETLVWTTGEDHKTELSNLQEKKNKEQQTSDVRKPTEVKNAENRPTTMIHTTPSTVSPTVMLDSPNKTSSLKPVEPKSPIPVIETKPKSPGLSKFAKRIYGKFLHHLEPVGLFREPRLKAGHRFQSSKPKTFQKPDSVIKGDDFNA